MEQRFDWNDLGFTGIATVDRYRVKWRILEISGWGIDDAGLVFGWWKIGEPSAFPVAEDPADAQSTVDITVKWDGCADYSWPSDMCTHTCDGGAALAALILRVHEVSHTLMHATADSA